MTRRIAVITHRFPTASETFVVDHVLGLARRGWDPVVVCQEIDGELLNALVDRVGSLRIVQEPSPRSLPPILRHAADVFLVAPREPRAMLSPNGRATLRRVRSLRGVLAELRPDVVHAHFATNGIAAALAARGSVPVIVDFHGWDFTVLPRQIGWGIFRRALRGCVLVAHSAFAQRHIEDALSRTVHRVTLGVALDHFRAPERSRIWPIPLRLLAVGRLVRQKGQRFAIEALARLVSGPAPMDAVLSIVGGGPEREGLESLAASLGVRERVRFLPAMAYEEVAHQMAASDVLVVPSIRADDGSQEAFGRVAIEGLACGLPVIGTQTGGLAETIGEAGWTVPPGDPEALASCIRRIIAERTPIDVCSAARSRAEQFSVEKMWDSYAKVAASALQGSAHGA